ncbi:cytochrome P450 18a1 [Caerostris extrusa]|uniref:Cytochrome P450 18a1 n=1 Tax=Caerostris extrusa TaxID=172846 RepID=A0AAV4XCE0_CAEEX|nr:cytochrome P450 18a1 [Caerostris extrusa]
MKMMDNILNVRYEVWIAVCVTILVYIFTTLVRKFRMKLPPGPMGLPIVGYFPFLSKDAHLKFMELSKKYGDVFSIRLGSELVVVLNDTASMREAFSKQELLGRPPNGSFTVFDVKSKVPFYGGHAHVAGTQKICNSVIKRPWIREDKIRRTDTGRDQSL